LPRIEKGKQLHCSETVTGKKLTGTLILSNDGLRADLYSYDEAFNIKTDRPLHLIAEKGQIVSLHSTIDNGLGSSFWDDRTVWHQGIIANVSVIGADAWTETDTIKRVTFTVKHTMELLRHQNKLAVIRRERRPDDEHFRLFEICVAGMTLKASYGAMYNSGSDTPTQIWPVYEIEYGEPQSLHDYLRHVLDYVHFLSFCNGAVFKPSDIKIDRVSFAEILQAMEAQSYRDSHEVYYAWPEVPVDDQSLWVGGSPIRAWDQTELGAFQDCLSVWMNRAAAWTNAYAMMMGCFRRNNVLSADRLINACRWFEEIPLAASQFALKPRDVEEIAAAAAAKAEALGHTMQLKERIKGAIRRIKEETAEDRFRRLLSTVERRFGANIFLETAIVDLKRALAFRGRCAHGHFNPESDQEFRDFSRSTGAMEALCYMLTALDLPLSAEGLDRIRRNPVVQDYRLSLP